MTRILIMGVALLWGGLGFSAPIYQSVDEEGTTVFTDTPVKDGKALDMDSGKFKSNDKKVNEEEVFEKKAQKMLEQRGKYLKKIKELEKEMEQNLNELKAAQLAGRSTEAYEAKLKEQKAELEILIQAMQNDIKDMMRQQEKLMKQQYETR